MGDLFLWLLCALFGLGFVAGLWAFVREKIFGMKPGSVRIVPHPCHIGSPGMGVSIRWRRDANTIVLKSARSYYFFLLLVMFVFGPLLTGLYVAMPERFDSPPLPILILVGMISLVAWLGFLNTCLIVAFRLPSVEVDSHEIRLLRGSEVVAKTARQDLLSLDEEITTYRAKSREIPNYGLVAVAKSGERTTLWIVSELARHEEAKAELESVLDLPRRNEAPGKTPATA